MLEIYNYRFVVLNLCFKSGENISKDKFIAVKWVGSAAKRRIKMLSGSGWLTFCLKVKRHVILTTELEMVLFLKAMIKVFLRRKTFKKNFSKSKVSMVLKTNQILMFEN